VLRDGVQAGQLVLASTPEAMAELFLAALEGSMLLGRGRQAAHGPRQVAETLFSTMRV